MFSMRGANDSSERQKMQRNYKEQVEKRLGGLVMTVPSSLSRSEAKEKHIVISFNGL